MRKPNLSNYIFLFSLLLFSCSEDDNISITGTIHAESLQSNTVNDEYKIYIYLPPNFDSSQIYDVIFQLDADYQFDGLAKTIETMVNENSINPKILIGIGYPNGDMRDRDYTISEISGNQAGSGGAENFYKFLTTELMPYIKNRYPVNLNNCTLVGHSLGGLFVYYSLLNQTTQTNKFSNYIAQSPSLWWDGGEIFNMEQNSQTLEGKLYSNVGEFENATMRSLSDEMKQRLSTKPNLQIQFQTIHHASHTDTKNNNYESFEFIFN